MSGILVISGVIIFIIGLVYFHFVLAWHDMIDDTAPRLTFKAFSQLYALNPQSWQLHLINVSYCREIDGHYNSQIIEFVKYPDVIRYKFFHGKIEEDRKELERIKNEKEFIKYVQCDIDDYRRRNIEEMEKHLQK